MGTFLYTFPVGRLTDFDDKAYTSFIVPADYVSGMTGSLVGIPAFTDGASNYDLDVNYGASEESPTTHSATDTASTYSTTANQFIAIDLSSLLTDIAAGDTVGVELRLGDAGDDIDVVGVKFAYISSIGGEGAADGNASTLCSGTTTYLDGEGNCNVLDGLEDFETPTDDVLVVGNGTTFDSKVLTDCTDTAGNHLNYDAATNTFSCGTSSVSASQNLFETISTTSGTSPVADSATDTLTLTAGTGITVTGDASTDTVTIASTVVDTNTNANTICTGTGTYLDGEGNCDTLDGVEDFETPTDDGLLVGNSTTFDTVVLSDCDDTSGNHLNYDTTANTFSCGTSSSSSSQNLFETMNALTGTDPVADSATDTLNWTSTGSTLTIAGDASTDTINLEVVTAPALSSDPTDCAANQFAQSIVASGDLTCAAIADADVPDSITIDLAATATALASDPTSCSANLFVTDIAANGTLSCFGVSGSNFVNNTLTFLDVSYAETLASSPTMLGNEQFFGDTGILFEGSTDDTIEGLLTAPTLTVSDKTWTLPNVNGTIITTGDTGTVTSAMILNNGIESVDILNNTITSADVAFTLTLVASPGLASNVQYWGANGIIFEGTTADSIEGLLSAGDPSGTDKTWTLPDATGNVVINSTVVTDVAGRSLSVTANTLDVDLELYTTHHTLWLENPTAADDFKTIWTTTSTNYTITSISCESDGTVNFDLQIDDGTPAGVNGSDIACSAYAIDGSLAGDTGLDAGERLDLAITSVSGSPTWLA